MPRRRQAGWTANVVMCASSTISHMPAVADDLAVDPGDEVVREAVRLELAAIGVGGHGVVKLARSMRLDVGDVGEPHRLDRGASPGVARPCHLPAARP